VFDGIAPRDRGGGIRRCSACNGIRFDFIHEFTSDFPVDVIEMRRAL